MDYEFVLGRNDFPPDEIVMLHQQLAAMTKERDEIAAQARMLDRAVEERNDQLAAKQAQIDALMLEFCPEEMTTPQTAQVLALIAAANARIEGMKAKNAIRESEGYALAYDDEAFFIEAGFLEQLAHQVINQ